MYKKVNSCSILYVLFAWYLGVCYGFVLLSSASVFAYDNSDMFLTGNALTYRLNSTVSLDEKGHGSKKVGFYVETDVKVSNVWEKENTKLLKFEIVTPPQLHIKSRKAPSPDGFVPHHSKLNEFTYKAFFITWKAGKIEKIYLPKGEDTSLSNMKKGIASLFQFQLSSDKPTVETDASGNCDCSYTILSSHTIAKTKSNCKSLDFVLKANPDEIFGTLLNSTRETVITMSSAEITEIISNEKHYIYLSAKEELGSFIEVEQQLISIGKNSADIAKEDDIETIIGKENYAEESLLTEKELIKDEDISFAKTVKELKDTLTDEGVGTLKSASSFIKLVKIGRKATIEDIEKALESKSNKKILLQLYDVLGFVQTQDSHLAVTKHLHFEKEKNINLVERYLWALSVCSHPHPDILEDLFKRFKKNVNYPAQVQETLILTIASMANNLKKQNKKLQVVEDVEETILHNLQNAKEDQRRQFFRALKNLKSEKSIPILLDIIKNSTQKEGVLAWKVIKEIGSWDENVLKAARKSFFQLDRKHDSSARALALQVLLESKPSDELIGEFLHYLRSNDTNYEVKQYLFQTLTMLADEDPQFQTRVLNIVRKDNRLNNYSTLSPRGLSTALKRSFLKSGSGNGSLVSVQELKYGIVKKGTVNINMEKNGANKEIFTLGIFTGGLTSFIRGGNDDDAEEADDEEANAGIELTVLGNQIRPFVFFEGQGEMMGHVWSGTASEKTPAFQALIMLQDHLENLRLGSGYIAEIDVKGAASFDLSGSIQISIFYSTAESSVEKSAGLIVSGSTKIDTSFVKSQVEFVASIEPKLNVQTNLDDFSTKMNFCVRLTQPDCVFKYNTFKIERIPGSKHKLRIAKYKKTIVPGVTYSLNRKNNQMCSAIFK